MNFAEIHEAIELYPIAQTHSSSDTFLSSKCGLFIHARAFLVDNLASIVNNKLDDVVIGFEMPHFIMDAFSEAFRPNGFPHLMTHFLARILLKTPPLWQIHSKLPLRKYKCQIKTQKIAKKN